RRRRECGSHGNDLRSVRNGGQRTGERERTLPPWRSRLRAGVGSPPLQELIRPFSRWCRHGDAPCLFYAFEHGRQERTSRGESTAAADRCARSRVAVPLAWL